MKFLKYLSFILIYFIFNISVAQAIDKIAFIDIDLILKNSNLGKSLLIEFEKINTQNSQMLKKNEKELKELEEEIKKKQNIISRDELNKELNILKDKIKVFNETKSNLMINFEKKRNKEINQFLIKINPIIQNYMDQNSIDILLERKNVFIGKNDSDITENILKNINDNLK